MHYIRFLKTPRLLSSGRGNAPSVVKAKVTVTTDLGESFLWADIGLVVELTDGTGSKVLGKGKEYAWKGSEGKRDLEIELVAPVSREKRPGQVLRLLVRPKDEFRSVDALESSLRSSNGSESTEGEGCVMAVRSMAINTVSSEFKTIGTGMAERTFKVGNSELHIWEETGESIARHIWDAGLLLSAYLASISPSGGPSPKSLPQLPLLNRTLSKPNLKVIELGAGCGIVGITLSTLFPTITQTLLTDLSEATEILTQNLSSTATHNISHQVLDWSAPIPQNVKDTEWDLVVVADCTYNPDVVPDLVRTLKRLGDVMVLLAMKVRHESEMVFFELMGKEGFVVREKCRLLLPVLGEDEVVEVFVFGGG